MFLSSVTNWFRLVYIDSYCQLDRIVNHPGDGLLGVPVGNYLNCISWGEICPLLVAPFPGWSLGEAADYQQHEFTLLFLYWGCDATRYFKVFLPWLPCCHARHLELWINTNPSSLTLLLSVYIVIATEKKLRQLLNQAYGVTGLFFKIFFEILFRASIWLYIRDPLIHNY